MAVPFAAFAKIPAVPDPEALILAALSRLILAPVVVTETPFPTVPEIVIGVSCRH